MVIGLCALPAPALAQERTPSPQELWEAYPVDPEPKLAAPARTAEATRVPSDAATSPAVAVPTGGDDVLFFLGIGLGALLLAVIAAALRPVLWPSTPEWPLAAVAAQRDRETRAAARSKEEAG
jgi:hypothetical protein